MGKPEPHSPAPIRMPAATTMSDETTLGPSCGAVRETALLHGMCPRCVWKAFADTDADLAKEEMADAPLTGGVSASTNSAVGLLRVPGFEMVEELGRGGMGIVYRARQKSPDREVAFKMVLTHVASSPEMAARFRIEARAVASLEHPNILPIYQVGEHDGLPWFSMKLAAGGTLAKRQVALRGRWREIAALAATLADAVQFAHERGVLHRDLKPENILFDEEGRAYISDFGLAKMAGEEQQLTRSVSIFGTPNFLSPEVADGGVRRATTASDVYALGALLFQLFTGRPPFEAESLPALTRTIADEPAPSPSRLAPGLPRDLEIICLRCLEKDPARRFPSARDLADDLRRWQDGLPIKARPAGSMEKLVAWARRKPALAGLSAALALSVVLGTTFLLRANRHLSKALGRAIAAEVSAGENLSAFLREEIQRLRLGKDFTKRSNILSAVASAAAILPTPRLRNDAAAVLAWPDASLPAERRVFRELEGTTGINGCSFGVSADGQWAVSGSMDGVHLWNLATGKRVWTGLAIAAPWNYGAFHPDGKSFLYSARAFGIRRREFTVEADGSVKVGLPKIIGPASDATILGHAANGRDWIVATERSGFYINRMELWPNGDPSKASLLAEGETMTTYSLAPDGRTGASALVPAAELRLWTAGPTNASRVFGPPQVVAKEFTPDGRALVLREAARYAVHGIPDGRVRAEWPAQQGIHGMAKPVFSGDGRLLAVAQGPDAVQVLDGNSFTEILTLASPKSVAIVDYRFTDGGRTLVVLNSANGLHVWHLDRLETELGRLGVGIEHIASGPVIRSGAAVR